VRDLAVLANVGFPPIVLKNACSIVI